MGGENRWRYDKFVNYDFVSDPPPSYRHLPSRDLQPPLGLGTSALFTSAPPPSTWRSHAPAASAVGPINAAASTAHAGATPPDAVLAQDISTPTPPSGAPPTGARAQDISDEEMVASRGGTIYPARLFD